MSTLELSAITQQPLPIIPEPRTTETLQSILDDIFDEAMQPRHFNCSSTEVHPRHWQKPLGDPLREFVGRSGKGFRSSFTQVCWNVLDNRTAMPPELPALVEALHAGSLIVDDIEDGAKERRGKPALHQLYGIDIALNAGNWLYFLPGAIVPRLNLDHLSELALHRRINETLFKAHAGQALDLGGRPNSLKQIEIPAYVATMTRLKTGELFAFAAASAAIVSGAPRSHERALLRFGRELGVALQMLDDLSTVTNSDRHEKAAEDFLNRRVTWLWAWAADSLGGVAFQQIVDASETAAGVEFLCATFRDVCADLGRQHVREQVARAWDALPRTLSNHPAMDRFQEEVIKLEKSYG